MSASSMRFQHCERHRWVFEEIRRKAEGQIQGGEGRAEYGKQVIEQLSARLKGKYGRGFSVTNLRYFRTFYTVYSDRKPEIRQIGSGELREGEIHHTQSGVLDDMSQAVGKADDIRGFSMRLRRKRAALPTYGRGAEA